jgi:hypothetical protein
MVNQCRPSAAAGFEPRYDINPNLQAYAGVSGESIDFPNRAAAEIDLYGGIRPTFGKLALDASARRRRLWIFAKRQCRQAEPELLRVVRTP